MAPEGIGIGPTHVVPGCCCLLKLEDGERIQVDIGDGHEDNRIGHAAYNGPGGYLKDDPIYVNAYGTIPPSPRSKPEREEWKLSEAEHRFNLVDLRVTQYTFPDGTRYSLALERLMEMRDEEYDNIRVPANPPKPPQSGSGVPERPPEGYYPVATGQLKTSNVNTSWSAGDSWSTSPHLLDRSKYVPTATWKGSTLTENARQWLTRRVSEITDMGKLTKRSEYHIRGIITSGAA